MSYIVKTSFYEGNTLHEEGTAFTHADPAYVEKCVADGNVVVGELVAAPAPDVVNEVVTDPLVPASENVGSPAPEAPESVVTPTEGVQPTAEDIQKTLSETGLGGSSENLVN